MRQGQASETARLSAMLRAVHPYKEAKTIFDDALAGALAGMDDQSALFAGMQSFEAELERISMASPAIVRAWSRIGRLSLAVRARYTEDELAHAVKRGVTQYVILGAGYDSFAYCRRDPTSKLRVIEVDHPDTQRDKLARLRSLSVQIPPEVTYVPVDFQRQSFMAVLRENAAYRHDEPAFFSWLGVTWYLSEEAIDRTLRDIASAANGSELILDYLLPDHLIAPEEQQIMQMTSVMAANRGEPGSSCIEPGRMEQRLHAAGFAHVVTFDDERINASYFDDAGCKV
jgi:methyltransferase (TIGR00027 family)